MIESVPFGESGGSLVAAVEWIEGVLLGTVGTSIAVLAMAWVGLASLGGRMSARRALLVVLGAFILFGAPVIVAGLMGMVRGAGVEVVSGTPTTAFTPPSQLPRHDPYAGASVPTDGTVRD